MEPAHFLIAGEWRSSPRKLPIRNPFTGQTEGEVFQAGPADINDAIEAAKGAFRQTRKLQSFERADALLAIAEAIGSRKEEFARLITSDTGKPVSLARAEVQRSIFTFTTASEEAKRIGGEVLPLDLAPQSRSRIGFTRRFPLGPISAITPFNFPLNLVAHKLGPAIAAGNSVVLKPSSSGSRVSLLLGEVILSIGLPRGAINIITCSGGEASQLVTDERLKLISFTGSPAVGWEMKAKAGKKKVVLELGGNAAVIVDEGVDPSDIVPKIIRGAFANAGQSCIAIQRILVHQGLFELFSRLFVDAVRKIPCGDPSDERTLVGLMVDETAASKVQSWVQEAVGAGARLLCGGSRNGAFLEPTVLTDVRPEMNVCSQEVFAPVVTLESFSTMKEAIQIVNNSRFGLQAGIFTNSLKAAFAAYEDLDVGGVMLNDVPTFRMDHMPYGGVKDSGFGREGIRYAIEEMTELKLLVANLS